MSAAKSKSAWPYAKAIPAVYCPAGSLVSCLLVTCIICSCLSAPALPVQTPDKTQAAQTQALVTEGEGFRKKYMFNHAEQAYRKALTLDPKSVAALLGLSVVNRHRGNQKLAYSFLETALHLDPKNADCYIESAKMLKENQQYDAAIASAKKAIALAPNNPEAYFYLGWAQDLKNDKAAEPNLKRALQLNPHNEGAAMVLAYLLLNQKRFAESQKYFQKAIKLAPKNQEYVTALADLLLAQGKTKEAGSVYAEMKKTFPTSVVPYLCLADMAKSAGKRTEQEQLLRQATKVKATNDAAWRALAEFYFQDKKVEESLKCARIACGFKPHEAQNTCVLGICLYGADRPKEAEEYFQKSADLAPNKESKLVYQGLVVRMQFITGKNDQAMALAKQLYRESPDDLSSISAMAWALMCFKRYDEGFALLRKAKAKFPHADQLDHDLMEGLFSAERYDQAKAMARQRILKDKNDSIGWICLMEIARKTHNKQDAEEAMKHLSSLKLDANESMEYGFSGLTAGAGNKALPALKSALDSSPEDADIILNARDPENEAELAVHSRVNKIKSKSAK